ncbi:hypothetical protein RIR_jg28933.t1 [Rhizophagus irregularis DAOM 181602=DAOM 197198]|nr:hypothetical protein RIR_jg28933.t1 [Rhizophagus irregularis DAOM 181602=DAOM 197198]
MTPTEIPCPKTKNSLEKKNKEGKEKDEKGKVRVREREREITREVMEKVRRKGKEDTRKKGKDNYERKRKTTRGRGNYKRKGVIGCHWLLFSKNDDSEIYVDEIAISVCGNDSEIDVPYYHMIPIGY